MITHWLALDVGTTGVKAALLDADGRVMRSASRDYPTRTAAGGIVEQSAQDWLAAAEAAVRELRPAEAEAIALAGQMQNAILVAASGEPVRPVILYSDTRARDEAAYVEARIGSGRLAVITGNAMGPSGLLAKLLWLQTNEPDSLERAAHLLYGAADYLALRWAGVAVTDTTTASTTELMRLEERSPLDEALFAALDLYRVARLLPKLVDGGAMVGELSSKAAKQLGLRAGLPVHLGPGDAGATTLGAGCGLVGRAYAYIGTSGWVAYSTETRPPAEAGVFTLAHPARDRYIGVAPLLTAGGNLDWLRHLFNEATHDVLIAEALTAPTSDLIYLPYLNGERSPINDPLARGAFIGLNAGHRRADLARAVLEGVAFAYRHALETLLGQPPPDLVLTGGGTRSEAWCSLIATVTHLPVLLADQASFVGARGAALAAQVARGERPDYSPAQPYPTQARLTPDLALVAHYDRQYQRFVAAYPALKPLFATIQHDTSV
ncbi:MAG: FGGY family carbohydrate kinase [Aggregatilineales bacterium]